MGNILRNSQRVEIYPLETHYPADSIICGSMAKISGNQEHTAIKTLRDNVAALKRDTGLSFRKIAKEGGFDEVVGRTINGLVKGTSQTRVDKIAAAAEGLKVEMWQLFIPHIAELSSEERAQLQELVDAFVTGGAPARQMLTGALKVMADAVRSAAPPSQAQRLKAR
jgi:hypothetical protein